MNAPTPEFHPGSLISARGREWVVLPESSAETLRLRPLGGGEHDETLIYLPLEKPQTVRPATFPWPTVAQARNHTASQMLLDALQLKLRSGAGPFRSFGNIAVEPRAYQLVPLLMALKLPTVRLLIADDVGIGKTIEGALIARELLDRGEIQRLTVLCPPHLCEQWQRELAERFHIHAVVVRSNTADRLERDLPPGTSLFHAHPYTVVSLDYIKSERRREAFQRHCPEFVIVDEAHTCTQAGQGRQQRYQLLKGLADDAERHLVLLTATPHSGDEDAFFNLLGLLRPDFTLLKDMPADQRSDLREALARHFVQRRRPDIAEWQDTSMFPERLTAEITYRLTGAWGKLFNDVLTYARELVERSENQGLREQRMNWWAALALLRCISSSPAAAVNALRTRLAGVAGDAGASDALPLEELEAQATDRVLDGTDDALSTDDIEPGAQTEDSERLQALIASATALTGQQNDPKLAKLQEHLALLLKDGFQPVVFCRYIATAHYLETALQEKFKSATVKAVTGELTPDEREDAVERLGESDMRILVATDCLSEGINLQGLFTAVVHYDLSWNPTRHEQREGRVDRFGQKAREVRSTMLYGEDNPVDGAVLQVILRKAESIRKELGILVPMPDNEGKLTQALMNAVLLRKGASIGMQAELDLFGEPAREIELAWESAREKARQNRSIFAQRRLRPEDVLPEWQKTAAVLGGETDVARFVCRAVSQLGAPLQPVNEHFKLLTEHLPASVRERLAVEGLTDTLRIDFHQPPAHGASFIHRTHPLVVVLADTLLERALDDAAYVNEETTIARAGSAFVNHVSLKTTVLLLRIRHQLTVTHGAGTRLLMCEEAVAVAASGNEPLTELSADQARALLSAEATRNMPAPLRDRQLQSALDILPGWQPQLEAIAQTRAQALLQDHRRVREASEGRGSYQVTASLPVDVMGVYVLLPDAAAATTGA
ncbi:helicase-related protein [Burkholderia pseudomallei]|uniref:helicase-related protein n=1 Tax=Burkholderia pseudomallei TaxID=28450 RepID=UPI0005382784|nr:helicase-related protein [Burkholderia pseudomallei]KGV26257.1 DEAD/DEAH box helicase family protein [Burkholderia pseudomallei MSHR4462]KGX04525.1 DEAD/DEAH box helicase family protein [Burkholderia pseudomallei MSHR640]ONC55968.1 helicase SNF2 [Burkholderia pseudomallei]ONC69453.1 helicase SNF2 [Burkholderia pseudomallei]